MKQPRQCNACREAQTFSTGSTIFYICKYTKQYRSTADTCNLKEDPKK